MPLPDEVAADIEALDVWRKDMMDRLNGKKKPAVVVAAVAA